MISGYEQTPLFEPRVGPVEGVGLQLRLLLLRQLLPATCSDEDLAGNQDRDISGRCQSKP